MLAVVSVVLVTVGIVSVLSLRGYVNAMSDADIAESLDAFSHQYTKYRNGEHTSTHPGTPPIGQAMLEFTGQTPGNLIAVLRNGVVIGSAVFRGRTETRAGRRHQRAGRADVVRRPTPDRNTGQARVLSPRQHRGRLRRARGRDVAEPRRPDHRAQADHHDRAGPPGRWPLPRL